MIIIIYTGEDNRLNVSRETFGLLFLFVKIVFITYSCLYYTWMRWFLFDSLLRKGYINTWI